jgi:hypothetical protein
MARLCQMVKQPAPAPADADNLWSSPKLHVRNLPTPYYALASVAAVQRTCRRRGAIPHCDADAAARRWRGGGGGLLVHHPPQQLPRKPKERLPRGEAPVQPVGAPLPPLPFADARLLRLLVMLAQGDDPHTDRRAEPAEGRRVFAPDSLWMLQQVEVPGGGRDGYAVFLELVVFPDQAGQTPVQNNDQNDVILFYAKPIHFNEPTFAAPRRDARRQQEP